MSNTVATFREKTAQALHDLGEFHLKQRNYEVANAYFHASRLVLGMPTQPFGQAATAEERMIEQLAELDQYYNQFNGG